MDTVVYISSRDLATKLPGRAGRRGINQRSGSFMNPIPTTCYCHHTRGWRNHLLLCSLWKAPPDTGGKTWLFFSLSQSSFPFWASHLGNNQKPVGKEVWKMQFSGFFPVWCRWMPEKWQLTVRLLPCNLASFWNLQLWNLMHGASQASKLTCDHININIGTCVSKSSSSWLPEATVCPVHVV